MTYVFVCCLSAGYGIDLLRSLKKSSVRIICLVGMMLLCTVSAVLSLGRELVSDYTAYSNSQVEAAAFVEENTPATSCFLTNGRHVNEISALAGRNVVNGAGTFLAFHGLYHSENLADFKSIYEDPLNAAPLLVSYGIDYIEVSSWERADYAVDEAALSSLYPCIFDNGEIQIYQVTR